MKIRIRGNSIRYRLTKPEVDTFCKTGCLMQTTDFGDNMFTYVLQVSDTVEAIDAQFKDHTITLFLEKAKSIDWNTSSRVGFSHTVKKTNGTMLSLLVEKDFVCMDETEEDQSDNYPNPKMPLSK